MLQEDRRSQGDRRKLVENAGMRRHASGALVATMALLTGLTGAGAIDPPAANAANAITAAPADLRQIDQGTYVIKTSDEAAALAALESGLAFQQAHPDYFYYTRTRIFVAPYVQADGTVDPDKELVTFFDEYDNYGAYLDSLLTAVLRPGALQAQLGFLKYAQIFDPQTQINHTVWTENTTLRTDIASREPLYPCCGSNPAYPDTPQPDPVQVNQNVLLIKKSDEASVLAAIQGQLAYEAANPDEFQFTRARVFTSPNGIIPNQNELVMVYYEYDDQTTFADSFATALETDATYQGLTSAVSQYALSGSTNKVWTEDTDARVNYLTREPLYPCCGTGEEENNTPPPVLSPMQAVAKFSMLAAAFRADPGPTTLRVLTNILAQVPSAVFAQIVLGIQNFQSAVPTYDLGLIIKSVALAIQRTISAGIIAATDVSQSDQSTQGVDALSTSGIAANKVIGHDIAGSMNPIESVLSRDSHAHTNRKALIAGAADTVRTKAARTASSVDNQQAVDPDVTTDGGHVQHGGGAGETVGRTGTKAPKATSSTGRALPGRSSN